MNTEAVVVDTNVLAVANRRDTDAGLECVLASARELRAVSDGRRIVIDDRWHIIGEYQRQASSSGQPGPGDAFLRWILVNRANAARCEQVSITPRGDAGDFEQFPDADELAGFDLADRKFVAVARASAYQPPVLNATDTDWWHYREALVQHGVQVRFLCPELMGRPRTRT